MLLMLVFESPRHVGGMWSYGLETNGRTDGLAGLGSLLTVVVGMDD